MPNRTLDNPIFQTIFTVLPVIGLAICIFPNSFPSFSLLSNYASLVMLAFLLMGIIFLFLKQHILTFVFFGACAILSLFLKYSVQNDSIERWRETVTKEKGSPEYGPEGAPFRIAHFNASNFSNEKSALSVLSDSKADLISIHEVTPHWDQWLKDSLSGIYPFSHTMVDIGLFGQAMYSKYEFDHIDTLYFRSIPFLKGSIPINGQDLYFINVHTEPALNQKAGERLIEHLAYLTDIVRQTKMPLVVLGDFNAVSWSNSLKSFRESTGLLESRTSFVPFSSAGVGSFLNVPIDHILYTPSLQCIGFEDVECKTDFKRMGICGTFHFKKVRGHAAKTVQ